MDSDLIVYDAYAVKPVFYTIKEEEEEEGDKSTFIGELLHTYENEERERHRESKNRANGKKRKKKENVYLLIKLCVHTLSNLLWIHHVTSQRDLLLLFFIDVVVCIVPESIGIRS